MNFKIIVVLYILTLVLLLVPSCSEESSSEPINNAPKIQSISANSSSVKTLDTTTVSCIAYDQDGDRLTYSWTSDNGTIINGSTTSSIRWQAPSSEGSYKIRVSVNDGIDTVSDNIIIPVIKDTVQSITITLKNPSPADGDTDQNVNMELTWDVDNPDNYAIYYNVHFGETSNPPKVVSAIRTKKYKPISELKKNTKYYWKVHAYIPSTASKTGPIWTFTTGE